MSAPIKTTAKVVSTITKGARTVKSGFVDQSTKGWRRIQLDSGIQAKFDKEVEARIDTFRKETTVVALQETPHKSKADNRTHFTALEMDGKGKVTATHHFAVKDNKTSAKKSAPSKTAPMKAPVKKTTK
ncbi:hypothetical protein QBC36DRAFT_225748 [Triangularia setosa]|uniref:Uncharacterized protein n=1 Tax=Triangularia setosa TaxID=2587417 RepID=A0AAN7A3D1_9PEZI|nr:hypothetical protein QBC36DRAFT_225748 [Podospora setosa]